MITEMLVEAEPCSSSSPNSKGTTTSSFSPQPTTPSLKSERRSRAHSLDELFSEPSTKTTGIELTSASLAGLKQNELDDSLILPLSLDSLQVARASVSWIRVLL